MSPLAIALISVLLGAIGQIVWKHGLGLIEFSPKMFFDPRDWPSLVANGWIPLGILCYFFSMVLWLEALARGELSQVYPMISINFVLLAFVGFALFGEHMGWLRIAGTLLIVAGVLAIALS